MAACSQNSEEARIRLPYSESRSCTTQGRRKEGEEDTKVRARLVNDSRCEDRFVSERKKEAASTATVGWPACGSRAGLAVWAMIWARGLEQAYMG
jgi:hypothetical protein